MPPHDPTHTRRQFLTNSALAAASAALLPHRLFTQQPPSTDRLAQMRAAAANAKITTQKLRGNVSVLMGSGGNIAVLPGKDGKLLVDSGYATSRPQLTEALNAISADGLEHLIDTHWHVDHTDGNDWIHSSGATIIAHDQTLARLSTPQHMQLFNMEVPASPSGALPTLVFTNDHTLTTNGTTLQLQHYTPAHTDSDLSVLFPDADILHTGDTWFNGMYPFIDYSSNGNIDGMIRASKRNLAAGTSSTILIPGHGPVGDKTQLQQFCDMLQAIRDNVATLKHQGKSLDETVAAKPTAQYDSVYGGGFIPPETFVRLVYQGV